MAFPQVRTPTTATSNTINKPSGTAAGDLLLAIMNRNSTADMTASDGFTELGEIILASSDGRIFIGAKIATGSEGATLTPNNGSSQNRGHVCYAIYNHGFALASEVELTTATGSSANPDPPSESASWGALDNLYIVLAGMQTNAVSSYPTNYGLYQTAAGSGQRIAVAARELAAASDNPGTYTFAGSNPWGAATIAIKPVVASGGPARLPLLGVG